MHAMRFYHPPRTHCKEDPIYVFLEMKLRGLIPNFHICVSVSDLYIITIGPPILLQQIQADRSWEYRNRLQIDEGQNWEEAAKFPFLGTFVSNFRYSIFAVHPVYFIPLFESLNPCLQESTTLPSLWLQLSKHRIGVLTCTIYSLPFKIVLFTVRTP